MPDLRNIKSMPEIMAFLREQADLRAPENDEGGILQEAADTINDKWLDLEGGYECADCGAADHPSSECPNTCKDPNCGLRPCSCT